MPYNILYIPTGQLVCYFNPQTLASEFKKKSWESFYRKPPQFWIPTSSTYTNYLIVPNWVITSIVTNRKMYKRLLEGAGQSIIEQENINNITMCFEEFEFIKLNE